MSRLLKETIPEKKSQNRRGVFPLSAVVKKFMGHLLTSKFKISPERSCILILTLPRNLLFLAQQKEPEVLSCHTKLTKIELESS